MANIVKARELFDGGKRAIYILTGILDTSNETNVLKVDVSGLSPASSDLRIEKIQYSVSPSMVAKLLWDADTNVEVIALSGTGVIDMIDKAITNDAGTGKTGDLLLSTVGVAAATHSYTIILHLIKEVA